MAILTDLALECFGPLPLVFDAANDLFIFRRRGVQRLPPKIAQVVGLQRLGQLIFGLVEAVVLAIGKGLQGLVQGLDGAFLCIEFAVKLFDFLAETVYLRRKILACGVSQCSSAQRSQLFLFLDRQFLTAFRVTGHALGDAGQHGIIGARVLIADQACDPAIERAHDTALVIVRCAEAALPKIHEEPIVLVRVALVFPVLKRGLRLGGGGLLGLCRLFRPLALGEKGRVLFQKAVDFLEKLIHAAGGRFSFVREGVAAFYALGMRGFLFAQLIGKNLVVLGALFHQAARFACGGIPALVKGFRCMVVEPKARQFLVGVTLLGLQICQGACCTLDPAAEVGFLAAQISCCLFDA
ncbi:hypothetical protein DYI23_08055 [Roseibium polysiphoniae]|uniref:Uncharacterized protein n=1 Tax=Roseibium polysiphoniae TaxID=2571221 RepID=A0A944GSH3_9HYPH|nr:hypothetical protein [Roseibium polysiphoniae]